MRKNWFDSLPLEEQDQIYELWSEISHLSRTEQTERVHAVLKDSVEDLPSRASVHRKFKEFEERCEALRTATHQAQAMMEQFGDDQSRLSEASLQMVQGLIFELMLQRGRELEPKEVLMIAKAAAAAGDSGLRVKQYQAKLKAKLEETFNKIEQDQKKAEADLDLKTIQKIREQVYGIFTAG